ncbi:MAG: RNase P subunit p30 family protein [Candidatus Bathyarchaeia archaeon]
MRRIYVDLHLRPDLKDFERLPPLISKASRLGYKTIAIALPANFEKEKIKMLQNMCKEVGMDFVSRVDLKPQAPKDLLQNLRKLRRRFEIIAVLCESKSVARQAAKDHRVDLLNFPSTDPRKRFFDEAEAKLASSALASLEIDMKILLISEGSVRIRLLSKMRREIATAKKFRVPIVISSGISDHLLMRKPVDMAALAFLFDLDEASALEAVSKNPLAIIKRNREKLSPEFVAPGVRLLRRGEDC